MKAPIDPSEPMFPVRLNEPVCQYYMKHGTCKFGQACKFNHPSQPQGTTALVGGATVVMNVGRKNDTSLILTNPVASDSKGSPMMLQFLPQRPDEPDCIFFLKNGRCKYGATCRYHHPVNFPQRRQDQRKMQQTTVSDGMINANKMPYTCQQVPQHKYQQGPSLHDGSLTFMAPDGHTHSTSATRPRKGSYQQLHGNMGNDGGAQYGHQPGMISMNPDHNSSSSTVSSSYDTASSNLQGADAAQGDPPPLWNRQSNSAHANVNSYTTDSPVHRSHLSSYTPRSVLAQNSSDGNLTSVRRHRSASYGSTMDYTSYLDNGGPLNRSMHASSSINKPTPWRTERSPSYDGTFRRTHHNQYGSDDVAEKDNRPNFHADHAQSPSSLRTTAPRPKLKGIQQPAEEVDDGLSMMTSALLNMLDTPEKMVREKNNSKFNLSAGIDHEIGGIRTEIQAQFNRSALLTGGGTVAEQANTMPMFSLQGPTRRGMDNSSSIENEMGGSRTETQAQFNRSALLAGVGAVAEPAHTMHMFSPQEPAGRGIDTDFLLGRENTQYEGVRTPSFTGNDGAWFPTWHHQAVDYACRPLDENAQSMSVMQPPHAATSAPHHATAAPNVGLFL